MKDSLQLPRTRRGFLAVAGAAAGGLALGSSVVASNTGAGSTGTASGRRYRATVANLTSFQPFTPPAIAAHRPSVEVFAVGEPANEPTKEIAENGNLGPLADLIANTGAIEGSVVGPDPLVPNGDPGDTGLPFYQVLEFDAPPSSRFVSFIAMLVATNDGFVGLDTVPLPPKANGSLTYFAQGYDAGTERNTEEFRDLVPPAQSLTGEDRGVPGTGTSDPDLAEDGVITPHPGITGVGDVPEKFDWPEPAASVQIERIA